MVGSWFCSLVPKCNSVRCLVSQSVFLQGTAHATVTGGTATVFYDVEQHKHKSPGDL